MSLHTLNLNTKLRCLFNEMDDGVTVYEMFIYLRVCVLCSVCLGAHVAKFTCCNLFNWKMMHDFTELMILNSL